MAQCKGGCGRILTDWPQVDGPATCEPCTLAALRAQLAEVTRDAERYRALRAADLDRLYLGVMVEWAEGFANSEAEFDERTDALRGEGE